MKIGRGEFLLGDCFEHMANIPDGSVDMILCDLPYGTTACKWDSVIPFEPLWREYWRILKPNSAVVLTASQPFTSALVMSQVAAFKVEWIWRKNAGSNFGTTKWYPMKEHESVCVFSRGVPTYNPIMQPRSEAGSKMLSGGKVIRQQSKKIASGVYSDGGLNKAYDTEHLNEKMRVPSSVQDFRRERGLHPTQKPVALFEYLIRTYTDEGMTVLDNCAGSGTTAIAAENAGRNWICIERDPDYYAKATERVIKHVEGLRAA